MEEEEKEKDEREEGEGRHREREGEGSQGPISATAVPRSCAATLTSARRRSPLQRAREGRESVWEDLRIFIAT